ncbi:MAG: hypothetical protein ACE5JU_10580 [Candidatus Binatia bacterium]
MILTERGRPVAVIKPLEPSGKVQGAIRRFDAAGLLAVERLGLEVGEI